MAIDLSVVAQVAGPVAGALTGALAGWFLARKRRNPDQTDAITRRITTLLNGYEKRINDLVAEVERLRKLIRELQAQLVGGK